MKKLLSTIVAVTIAFTANAQVKSNGGYPIIPVPFTSVKVVENSF